ncbi:hypothetical protein [Salmonirosea aquatica]|uniref:Uncharacterized protein n=1 Tax=Salmonirosea aquatica TaxID=2654236 RepID=A0A7C9FBA4_9BACT|nr:hypothetical protein [Cytophagaceae bacterium SJW1-29]
MANQAQNRVKTGQNPANLPTERVKFYADAPDGTKNKLLVYKVHDLGHSIDLLNRFDSKGWNIRAAWHLFDNGNNVRLRVWKL